MSTPAHPMSSAELAAFAAAQEAGSIHAAADALGLTASALSKRIASLERRLGVQLFQRGRRGLVPTDAAQRLHPHARIILAALDQAERDLAADARSPVVLHVRASQTIAETVLPAWLAAFRATADDVTARVEVANTERVLAMVREQPGVVGLIEGPGNVRDLQVRILAADEIVGVVRADHPWAGRVIDPTELAGTGYVARERGSGTRDVVARHLEEVDVQLVPELELGSIAAIRTQVAQHGFSMLSRRSIGSDVATGRLATFTLDAVDLRRSFRAVRARAPTIAPGSVNHLFWEWLARSVHPE